MIVYHYSFFHNRFFFFFDKFFDINKINCVIIIPVGIGRKFIFR